MLVKLERKHKQRLQVGYFVVNLFNRFHLNYGNLYWLAEAIDGFEDKTTAISTLRHPEKKLDSIIISIISRSFSRQYLRPFFPNFGMTLQPYITSFSMASIYIYRKTTKLDSMIILYLFQGGFLGSISAFFSILARLFNHFLTSFSMASLLASGSVAAEVPGPEICCHYYLSCSFATLLTSCHTFGKAKSSNKVSRKFRF